MLSPYLNLIIWWIIFFLTHSLLASTSIKEMVNNSRPIYKSYYRLFFNLLSIILLLPIIYYYTSSQAIFVYESTIVTQILGSLLGLAGAYILVAGFKNYRTDEFIGIYQIKNKHDFHPTTLNRTGWNGVVRHPLYFGGIVLAVGLCLITPSFKLLITVALIIVYLYIGTLWEEKKLIAEFGEVYKKYQKEVSMLIPARWILNKIGIS